MSSFEDELRKDAHRGWSGAAVICVALGCLVVGYFAGREHLKYEVKSAASEALTAVRKSFGSSVSRKTQGGAHAEKVEIVDGMVDSARSRTRPVISGKLKNTGSETISRVVLTAYFNDADGNAIFESTYIPVAAAALFGKTTPLRPNYIVEFSFKADRVPEEWDGKSVSIAVTEASLEE